MSGPPRNYAALDDFALSCYNAAPRQTHELHLEELGPQIEHLLLAQQLIVPTPATNSLIRATTEVARNRVHETGDGTTVLRLSDETMADVEWTKLLVLAKRVAVNAGFGGRVAGQLAAALAEMVSNALEHSGACSSGILAFKASERLFEFVVADEGRGALGSLRTNRNYAGVRDAREALPLILQDGCSCTGDVDRGKGFNDLFRGLANQYGRLRFRSGDAAVVISGQSPTAIRPKVKSRAPLAGFIASVCCVPS